MFPIQILGRTIRVDHCEQYKVPNADMSKVDELTAAVRSEGCAPTAPLLPTLVPKAEPVKIEGVKMKEVSSPL